MLSAEGCMSSLLSVCHHALRAFPFGLMTYTLTRDYIPLRGLHTRLRRYSQNLMKEVKIVAGKNLLMKYSEQLAIEIDLLCRQVHGDSNAVFQIKKSSSSVFANISEAQYPQSLPDMLSKFQIARKECVETESWLKLLFSTSKIDENTYAKYRNLCGRIRRLLTCSCVTIETKINQTK